MFFSFTLANRRFVVRSFFTGEKIMETRFFVHLAAALLAVITTRPAQAEVVNVGAAIRQGSISNGFPKFLSQINATTQAWNLGGTNGDTLFNGINVVDAPLLNSTVGDLTTVGVGGSTVPLFVNAPTFAGNADGQDAARNAIFSSGFQGFVGGPGLVDYTLDVAATQGETYQVELLADPQNGNRTADVTVDGALFADDLWASPSAGGVTLVYRFQVVADADGIDILLQSGSGLQPDGVTPASTAAIFSAISVTRIVTPGEFDDADFSFDNEVSGLDFLIWQRGFGSPGGLAVGDANADGMVNGLDLAIWESQFGTVGPLVAAIGAVPEPTTLGLFLLATSALTIFNARGCRTSKRLPGSAV